MSVVVEGAKGEHVCYQPCRILKRLILSSPGPPPSLSLANAAGLQDGHCCGFSSKMIGQGASCPCGRGACWLHCIEPQRMPSL